MKQHINSQQWNELSKVAQRKVEDLFNPETEPELRWAVHYFQINIGWMIEFLDMPIEIESEWCEEHEHIMWYINGDRFVKEELCDALWEAVKEELEKE